MYLPALGKSRKISGSSKDGKFLGSDLYFYDLEDHDLDDFTYKFIKEEVWEGHEYYVVESYPKDKKSALFKKWLTGLGKITISFTKRRCMIKARGDI